MITLNDLAEKIRIKLNNEPDHKSSSIGYVFSIETDTGELKKDTRNENDEISYINGLIRSTSSDMTNLTDGNIVATQSCSLSLILRLKDTEDNGGLITQYIGIYGGEVEELPEEPNENDFVLVDGVYYGFIVGEWREVIPTEIPTVGEECELTCISQIYEGYRNQIRKVREFINSVLQNTTYEDMTDSDGKHFAVTTIYELLDSGEREQVEELGDSFTFRVSILYMFVQNGLNAQDIKYYLDGNRIPFQALTTYQTPTLDGNVYANTTDGRTKSLASQSIFTLTIELPILNNEVSNAILDFLFNGELNVAHVVTIEKGSQKQYLMGFAETLANSETVKNVGGKISLTEVPNVYDLVEISPDLYLYEKQSVATPNETITLEEKGGLAIIDGDMINFLEPDPSMGGKKYYNGYDGWAQYTKFISTKEITTSDYTRIN